MKRSADFFVSIICFLASLPVQICIAVFILVINGRPVLFLQMRPGLHGKLFTLYKFRTMTMGGGADKDRLTRLGKFLRKTSLDELPQLWNVLCGDMSIVGPRPLLPEYLPLYTERQARRHDVRPGITGWSQVNGRNELIWKDRLEMDVWYVEHSSFLLDCRIILKTVGKVFAGSGVSADGQATVEPFRGSQKK